MTDFELNLYDRIHIIFHDAKLDNYWDIVRDFTVNALEDDVKHGLLAYGKILERMRSDNQGAEVLKALVSAMYSICFTNQNPCEALERFANHCETMP